MARVLAHVGFFWLAYLRDSRRGRLLQGPFIAAARPACLGQCLRHCAFRLDAGGAATRRAHGGGGWVAPVGWLTSRTATGLPCSQPADLDRGSSMLELRPTCEHCNKPLLPTRSRRASAPYECTFCAACVETVLDKDLPQLRRRLRAQAGAAGAQLEGRQLTWAGIPPARWSDTNRLIRLLTPASPHPSRASRQMNVRDPLINPEQVSPMVSVRKSRRTGAGRLAGGLSSLCNAGLWTDTMGPTC